MTLGTDFSGGADLHPALLGVGGTRALSEALVRRLSTETGALADYPDYGEDLTQFIGTSEPTVEDVEAAVLSQCYLEEEIESVSVTVTLIDTTLSIKIDAVSSDGPFDLTLNVTELSVEAIIPQD